MNNNGLKIASITLGVLSIIFFPFIFVSIPTGVLAIIYGVKCEKEKPGIITGIIGVSLCVAFNGTMIPLFMTGVLHF